MHLWLVTQVSYTHLLRELSVLLGWHAHWYYFLTQWYTEASGADADEDKENRPDTSDMEEADNSNDKDLSNQLDDVFNTQNSDSSQDSQAAFK